MAFAIINSRSSSLFGGAIFTAHTASTFNAARCRTCKAEGPDNKGRRACIIDDDIVV